MAGQMTIVQDRTTPSGRTRTALFQAVPLRRAALLRVAVYLFTICDTFWVVNDVQAHSNGPQAMYRPLYLRQWFHLPTPNHDYALTLHVVIIVGCLLAAS